MLAPAACRTARRAWSSDTATCHWDPCSSPSNRSAVCWTATAGSVPAAQSIVLHVCATASVVPCINYTCHTRASCDCGSRGVTAAASRGLAAGQSTGGSASPVRSESAAPLPPTWPRGAYAAAACLARSQLWLAARPALCSQTDARCPQT